MIDLHCHLDLYPDPARIARSCAERRLYVLSVTTTPSAWYGTNALAQGRVRTALGFHPQLAHERKAELGLFDDLVTQVRYIGEVGLDGSRDYRVHWRDQLTVFEHVLNACAKAGGRILSIHSRSASKDVISCLRTNADAGIPILHWFSGSEGDLKQAIDLGCWFSVGPVMLRSVRGRALVSLMPTNRVLPESDGPFAQLNGVPLLPWDTQLVNKELSKLWGVERKEIDQLLLRNLRDLAAESDDIQR